MIDFYSKTDANLPVKKLRQPALQRQRHRFRGPRESEKINLESQQFRADIIAIKALLSNTTASIGILNDYFDESQIFQDYLTTEDAFVLVMEDNSPLSLDQ